MKNAAVTETSKQTRTFYYDIQGDMVFIGTNTCVQHAVTFAAFASKDEARAFLRASIDMFKRSGIASKVEQWNVAKFGPAQAPVPAATPLNW